MDLRQLRCFVRVVELGSMARAALDLQVSRASLDEDMTQLQHALSVSLLQPMCDALVPTEAGLAFFREAQLALRHADQAAQESRSPLLEERLFFIQSARHPAMPLAGPRVCLFGLRQLPLILPTGTHSLRNVLDAAFSRAHVQPTIITEIDSLAWSGTRIRNH